MHNEAKCTPLITGFPIVYLCDELQFWPRAKKGLS